MQGGGGGPIQVGLVSSPVAFWWVSGFASLCSCIYNPGCYGCSVFKWCRSGVFRDHLSGYWCLVHPRRVSAEQFVPAIRR